MANAPEILTSLRQKKNGQRSFWKRFGLCLGLVFAVQVGLGHFWQVQAFSRRPNSYYANLTDAFVHGQTYFMQEPDSRLAQLANPYAGAQDIPRIHDASYFNHHYYLYFGAAPAVSVMLPIYILSGFYISEPLLVLLFCFLGSAANLLVWKGLQEEYLPTIKWRSTWLIAIVLGWGSYIPLLLISPIFYQVASASGYFFVSLGLLFGVRAALALSRKSACHSLIIASLSYGLAVGSRPTYTAALPALGILAVIVAFKHRSRNLGWFLPIFSAVLPAALVGLGLALYNYERFANPFEFGIKYQFAAGDMRQVVLASIDNLLPNIKQYIFAGTDYRRYFPFVIPRGTSLSLWPWAPLAFSALLLPITTIFRHSRTTTRIGINGLIFTTALFAFAALLLFPFPLSRYALDFLPTSILAGAIGLNIIIERLSDRAQQVGRVFYNALIVVSLLYSSFFLLGELGERAAPIARILNYPTWAFEKAVHTKFGALEGSIVIQDLPAGTKEPIATTGGDKDVLFLEHLGNGTARFGFFHLGAVSPDGAPFLFTPGQPMRIKIDLGGLYPPAEHPIFSDIPEALINILKRRVGVAIDGKLVYEVASPFYFSTPGLEHIGTNPSGVGTLPFCQSKLNIESRSGIPSFPGPSELMDKNITLHVRFPGFTASVGEPLLSLGKRGKGDLVYVTYVSPRSIRLGVDSALGGSVESSPLSVDSLSEHSIYIDFLTPRGVGGTTLRISYDGAPVLFLKRSIARTSAFDIVIGYNGVGSSAARMAFSGPVLSATAEPRGDVAASAASKRDDVCLLTMLPTGRSGAREPFITSGVSGRADLIYFIYKDDWHLQIGYDHWGVGGWESDPIAVDYSKVNVFRVKTPALWSGNDAARKSGDAEGTINVSLNGTEVLNRTTRYYNSSPDQLALGHNDIGASSCEPLFTGSLDLASP